MSLTIVGCEKVSVTDQTFGDPDSVLRELRLRDDLPQVQDGV